MKQSREELLKRLREMTTVGKKVRFKRKGGPEKSYVIGVVVDEVSVMDPNPEYRYFIQKIQRTDGIVSYRICYYTLDSEKTRISFGQFSSEIPEEQFKELLKLAHEKWGL